MESLLQREKMDQITELFQKKVCNLQEQVVYIPVRHHSPACSYHLQKTITSYQPEIILIEGPENSNHIIELLAHEETKPPVSIYYSYSTTEQNYTCYYPMLEYSPEYVALKMARNLGIPAQFIDLSYGSRLESIDEGHDLKQENKKNSYHNETLLASSMFITRLCQKMNCRNFDELWEKVFEIEGIRKTTEDFFHEVFAYCYLSRMCYEYDTLEAEGNLIREAHMKKRIAEAREKYAKILVVTGGFHTYGLLEERTSAYQIKPVNSEQVYPMVYTFKEADHLNGYASGMPYVNYYDTVWSAIQKKEVSPYHKSAASFLSHLLKRLRTKGESVSVADAIEAYSLVQGLSVMRSKSEGGAYELIDAVTSAFTKGERTIATSQPIETLHELMMGDRIGEIVKNDLDVPIVRDFREQCKKYKFQLKTTGKNQKILELYAKPMHRKASQFLHSVQFLGTEFAMKIAGPDWVMNKNVNLIRETWTYSYSSYVEARLIENSIYGGSVKEAAISKIEAVIKDVPNHHSHGAATWLLQAVLMGLEELSISLFNLVEDYVKQDGSFISLCQTLTTLTILHDQKRLFDLQGPERVERLIDETYYQAVSKIYGLTEPNPDQVKGIVENLKFLYMLSAKRKETAQEEIFIDQLRELLSFEELHPMLEGAVTAILCNLDVLDREQISSKAKAYIFGTPDKILHTATYLQGVFSIARDVFLQDENLLTAINQLVSTLSYEDFIQVTPELRLAFTYFTPLEITHIADKVAALYNTTREELLTCQAIDEREIIRAKKLDHAIKEEFARWNLM
ncbi:DUF5682 family protein [Brevibacillus daliensis]|uniref:DUF5682 family protein n=1 Tax=Brevibacillus daliensis TaxID=2892995 RepID=UPI001E42179D|nr:DUF5682 family protein [Brevibacillus daliensis]